jgi:peptidylprolyl isomerase
LSLDSVAAKVVLAPFVKTANTLPQPQSPFKAGKVRGRSSKAMATNRRSILTVLVAIAALSGVASIVATTTAAAQEVPKAVTTASGLQIIDTKIGTGASPRRGQTCVMHYTGWLYQNGAKGRKFDSSVDRGQPFEFSLGQQRVIAGWDEGVASMKVGGKRTLVIPPELGYGARGAGGVIPPNATLIFEVELLDVKG